MIVNHICYISWLNVNSLKTRLKNQLRISQKKHMHTQAHIRNTKTHTYAPWLADKAQTLLIVDLPSQCLSSHSEKCKERNCLHKSCGYI